MVLENLILPHLLLTALDTTIHHAAPQKALVSRSHTLNNKNQYVLKGSIYHGGRPPFYPTAVLFCRLFIIVFIAIYIYILYYFLFVRYVYIWIRIVKKISLFQSGQNISRRRTEHALYTRSKRAVHEYLYYNNMRLCVYTRAPTIAIISRRLRR